MRTFFALICSLAIACAASGQVTSTGGGGGAGAQKKKQTQSAKPAATPSLRMSGNSPYITLRAPDGSLIKPTPSPHGYVGRNDGRVQQSTATGKPVTAGKPAGGHYIGLDHSLVNKSDVAKPPSGGTGVGKPTGAGKATTVGKPTKSETQQTERELMDLLSEGRRNIGNTAGSQKAKGSQQIATQGGQTTGGGAGSPAVQLNKFSNTTFKPTTVGRPTTVGALGTSPAPKRAVWSHNAGSLSNRPMLNDNIQSPSGASQGQGKPAKASKKNDQRATPEYHKVWEDGKLPSGGTGVGKPTANAVTGKPTTGQRATTYGRGAWDLSGGQAVGSPTPKGKPTGGAPFITRIVPWEGSVTEHGVTDKAGQATRSHETVTTAGKPKTKKGEKVSPTPIPR
jgi:hypothetical protein